MSESLDRTVARMNIGHFRKRLAEERDGRKRETILLLLEEEERKLAGVPQGGQACHDDPNRLPRTEQAG